MIQLYDEKHVQIHNLVTTEYNLNIYNNLRSERTINYIHEFR